MQIVFIFIFLINILFKFVSNSSIRSHSLTLRNSTLEMLAARRLKQYQVGIMNKVPNGPLSKEEAKETYDDQENENNENAIIGTITFSDRTKYRPLGKLRIRGTGGIKIVYPTDRNNDVTTYNEEKERHEKELERIKKQKDILLKNEKDFEKNPYEEILQKEHDLIEEGTMNLNKNYKKNLLNLAVQKEEEIFNNLKLDEYNEIHQRRFNRDTYNQIYKLRSPGIL